MTGIFVLMSALLKDGDIGLDGPRLTAASFNFGLPNGLERERDLQRCRKRSIWETSNVCEGEREGEEEQGLRRR